MRQTSSAPLLVVEWTSILKKPFSRASGLGPSPGSGRTRSRSLRVGPTERPATRAAIPPRDPGRLDGSQRQAAGEHQLAVAELAAVGVVLQGVAAADDAAIDRAHHKGGEPAAEVLVVDHSHRVAFVAEVGLGGAVGAEGVGIDHHLAQRLVGLGGVELAAEGVDGAAADPAAHAAHDQGRLLEVAEAVGGGVVGEEHHADVGGIESNPQVWTIRAPLAFARSSAASIERRMNRVSPVRSQ